MDPHGQPGYRHVLIILILAADDQYAQFSLTALKGISCSRRQEVVRSDESWRVDV